MDLLASSSFDRIPALAAAALGAPMAILSLHRNGEPAVVLTHGVPASVVAGLALTGLVSEAPIVHRQPFILDDRRTDPRFRDAPPLPSLGAIAYCGVPVDLPAGEHGAAIIGSLSVFDKQARRWGQVDLAHLVALADLVRDHLALGLSHRHAPQVLPEPTLLDRLSDGLFRVDRNGYFVWGNEQASLVLTGRPASLAGRHYLEFIRPDWRDAAMQHYGRQLHEGAPITYFEFPLETVSGEEMWVGQNVQLDHGPDGEVVSLTGVARNLTPQRAATEAVSRRDRILSAVSFAARALLSTSSWRDALDPVMVQLGEATSSSRVLLWELRDFDGDPVLVRRCGWAPGTGDPSGPLALPIRQSGLTALRDRLGNGEVVIGSAGRAEPVLVAALLGSEPGPGSFAALPVVVDGAMWGALTVAHAKRAHWSAIETDALRAAADVLAAAIHRQRVAEALMQSEASLRRSQKMEAIGRFAGGLAHDVNNALTAIRGYAQLATIASAGNDRARRDLAELIRAADRAATFIRQLLTFARREPMPRQPQLVEDVIDGIAALLRPMLSPSIELVRVPSAAQLWISGDRSQLDQVLMNLVINARDAMPSGGALGVEARRETVGGVSMAAIAVSDTGTGISPDVLEHLFEPFFTTKPPGEGTGLGLATAFSIVRGLGGTINVETGLGAGSVFTVRLPLVEAPPTLAAIDVRSAALPRTASVLVVEDEVQVLEVTRRLLEDAGFQVRTAANGGEALEMLAADPGGVQVIVSDVLMPNVDGIALARRVRDTWPGLKIILTSGHLAHVEGLPAERLADQFLPKPFDSADLLTAIRHSLAN